MKLFFLGIQSSIFVLVGTTVLSSLQRLFRKWGQKTSSKSIRLALAKIKMPVLVEDEGNWQWQQMEGKKGPVSYLLMENQPEIHTARILS